MLITAFKPYDRWTENSSWLTLQRWLHDYDGGHQLVTRVYPVDLPQLEQRLQSDLDVAPEAVLHLGQAPGAPAIAVEEIALNVAGMTEQTGRALRQLVAGGPVAYRSRLNCGSIASAIRDVGTPASVSYHAGTFLCNALYYLSQHQLHCKGLSTPVVFLHLPLTTRQVIAAEEYRMAAMEVDALVRGVEAAVEAIAKQLRSGRPLESA